MKYTLDFRECLKDSPKFRLSLEHAECDVERLEAKLDRVVRLCKIMLDAGKAFSDAGCGFVTGLKDLSAYFREDELVTECLGQFCESLNEMIKCFNILMDQGNRSVVKNFNSFIKTEIKKVKETRKHFEKISDDLDSACARNSQAQRSKAQECEDSYNLMTANKSCFAHTSLDYVYQINILQSKKRFDVLETMLSFMQAHATFFHQGHEMFNDHEEYMSSCKDKVKDLHSRAKVEWKEMEERHHLVQDKAVGFTASLEEDNGEPHMEGYLFKKTKHAFKAWVRRWFTIDDNQLRYQKRTKDKDVTIMEEDLRLCTVKPNYEIDRRFCFEVLSPSRSHMLQAHTEEEFQAWVSAIQSGVTKAYRDAEKRQEAKEALDESQVSSSSGITETDQSLTENESPAPPKKSKAQINREKLYQIPGNSMCCDCGAPDPNWVSINLGITLCIECSGIHRGFGVHVSKVRSITLDSWEPELFKVMSELGNDVVNRIYLVNIDESMTKPANDSNRSIKEAWIRAKYVEKRFVSKLTPPKLAQSTSESGVRGWRVKKKTRKSPQRIVDGVSGDAGSAATSGDSSKSPDTPDSDVISAVLSVTTSKDSKDSDSGVVASASENSDISAAGETAGTEGGTLIHAQSSNPTDIIVFGTDFDLPDFDLDISSESSEAEEDTKSTTSWEDMSTLDPNMLLYRAAQARNLPVMLEALANSANINWVCMQEGEKTPIMKAVETGSLSACEFLLLNGAKLDRKDGQGRTPLHIATMLGNTGQVCQFLKRGADIKVLDNDGHDPLSIAVSAANADIVTLLRLAKLNEEMKESDDYLGSNPGDETFNDVFRDFTNMASNNPEKLKRNK